MTMPPAALRVWSWPLFILLLICPFHRPRSSHHSSGALGLLTAAPTVRPTASRGARRHGHRMTLFGAPLTSDAPGSAAESSLGAAASQKNAGPAPSRRDAGAGARVPPSQNVAQRRGRVFAIQQPQDLLDFVIEDERLSVVKVYASWCKTCRVFDVRYRKLAAELGDTYDAETGTDIAQPGRVRFAEMKYDDPNNEEMCKLLNATKLPYIFLYKGSKGQVDEFQCGPAQFRRLIDAVHEHADPAEDGEAKPAAESPPPPREGDATMPVSEGGETLEGLREQRDALEREKLEMFEIMKAQIEHDKAYIQQLETGVENQRAMLDAQEGQVSKITHEMEQQRALFQSTEADRETLADDLRRQTVTTQRARDELAAYKAHVHQLTQRISKIQGTITTVEAVASGNERAAREKESTLVRQREEWEKEKDRYERERNSLRKLSVLGLKRVGRGIRALASRIRRKGVT